MRALIVVIVSAVLGSMFGMGTSWAKLGRAPDLAPSWNVLEGGTAASAPPEPVKGPQPRAEVDATEHDFGLVERGHAVEQAFRISNHGRGMLHLKSGGTTCGKCTISKIPTDPIPTGESADVVVEYKASIDADHFRQSATILTNDELSPRIVLTVSGRVASSYSVSPREVIFSQLGPRETQTAMVRIISFLADNFEIESAALLDADSAPHFDVQVNPIEKAALTEPDAKRGYTVAITVKPGLPLGPTQQRVQLKTNLENAPTIDLPVAVSVVSDISITGKGWDRENGRLMLGIVPRDSGVKRELWIWVHGEQRHEVRVSVGQCEPDFLRVTVGDPVDQGATAVRIPLTIEVPPGAPRGSHLGAQGTPDKPGKVILETTDANAQQLKLNVHFAVED